MSNQLIVMQKADVRSEVIDGEVVFIVEQELADQNIDETSFLEDLVNLSLQRFMIRKSKELAVGDGLSKRFYAHA